MATPRPDPLILTLGTTPALSRTMRFATLRVDAVNRARSVHEYAAGKSVNAARAAATLGARVRCVAPVGGERGVTFRRSMDAAQLDHALVATAAATRLVITAVDEAQGTSTELIEEGGRVEADELAALSAAWESALPDASAAVLSGSLAAGADVAYYAGRVASARAAGVPVVLDAAGAALDAALAAGPDVIKINAGELFTLATATRGEATRHKGEEAGADIEAIARAAARVAAISGGWVVVTRGAASTIAVHAAGDRFAVEPPPLPRAAVSPIGSGDSFAGGVAVGLARGQPLRDAVRLGTACAAANVMTADAAHFARADVEALLAVTRAT